MGSFNLSIVCNSCKLIWILPSPSIQITLDLFFAIQAPMLAGREYPIGEFPKAENNFCPSFTLKDCMDQVK